jgi:CcmD family protein
MLVRAVLTLGLVVVLSAATVATQQAGALPQPTATAPQSLRPYWHVFVAYAIAIVLIGGWAVSIARRLRDVESRLID